MCHLYEQCVSYGNENNYLALYWNLALFQHCTTPEVSRPPILSNDPLSDVREGSIEFECERS